MTTRPPAPAARDRHAAPAGRHRPRASLGPRRRAVAVTPRTAHPSDRPVRSTTSLRSSALGVRSPAWCGSSTSGSSRSAACSASSSCWFVDLPRRLRAVVAGAAPARGPWSSTGSSSAVDPRRRPRGRRRAVRPRSSSCSSRAGPRLHHLNFFTQDMAGVRPTAPLTQGGVLHAIVGTLIEVGIAVGHRAAARHRHRGLHDRGRRPARRRRAHRRRGDDRAARHPRRPVHLHGADRRPAAGSATGFAVVAGDRRDDGADHRPLGRGGAAVVPGGLREAGLRARRVPVADGAARRAADRPAGLATALILGIARGIGETAPLLIVSGASTFTNADPFHNPMNSLPLFIFTAVRSGEPQLHRSAASARPPCCWRWCSSCSSSTRVCWPGARGVAR